MKREPKSTTYEVGLALATLFLVTGCGVMEATRIDEAITEHQSVANRIHLGDDKDHVLAVLNPIQERLLAKERKAPESYLKDGATVEIYFARSARQPDGLTTDDEFTPYVFTNGNSRPSDGRRLVVQKRKVKPTMQAVAAGAAGCKRRAFMALA